MEIRKTDLLVIGAGPGGYTAAFYAAAHGKKVIIVEKSERLGGVCLNCGCIPSKALLHISKLIRETREASRWGLDFSGPQVHLEKVRTWKESVLEKLGQGIESLAKRRSVEVVRGQARFDNPMQVSIATPQGAQAIQFEKAIIATGSQPILPSVFNLKDKRMMTSTEALSLEEIPQRLLVIGGGYIGMELGTVYAALGSEVVVAEAMNGILLGADPDLVRLVQEQTGKIFKEIRLNAKVISVRSVSNGLEVQMMTGDEEKREVFDRVLVAVGRTPCSQELQLDRTKVQINEKGFIQVGPQQQTADPTLYAVGDVAGGILLAHKASKEAKVAVEHICGNVGEGSSHLIPAVVFTDPELAWCGLTETEAKTKNIPVQIVKFPWSASGRALTLDRTDGTTKFLIDPKTEKLLGVGICGVGAGELISEGALAVEAGMRVKDLASLVHPHPTLSETLMECAEMFYGHATHAYSRKR